ncbi:MAG: beta-ketoacyl-ACP synthase III [Endomicrobiia bacterium]|nr:beta-ketoacyl-ACP synthase III [Endomicrobiia bacterium]
METAACKSVGVKIVSTGRYLPEKILTNEELSKIVETSDEWITTRTGIKERRIAAKGALSSDLGAEAAKIALTRAGLSGADIDMLICATITPDKIFPSTACYIQQKIGAAEVPAFDVSAACSGFIYALGVASGFIRSGAAKRVLIVGAEVLSKFTDWHDRSTCVLFGDGAGAMVLEAAEGGTDSLLSLFIGADGQYAELLHIPAGGASAPATEETVKNRLHFMKMSGKEVFKVAVTKMAEAFEKALAKTNLKPSDINLLIPHQANMRIIDAVSRRLGFPMEKTYVNVHKYGNISAATTIVALDEALEEGRLNKGDTAALVAFGGGFTWGAAIIRV